MVTWILLALVVYYAGVFLPSLFLIPRIGVVSYMASRDGDPEPGVMHARAKRATRNALENLAPFLGLGVLALVVPDTDMDMAILGAQLYVFGRAAFLPIYVFAVPVVRSLAFTTSMVGMVMMALALI
jgi:uncharacterized MAPEG superfamily protein